MQYKLVLAFDRHMRILPVFISRCLCFLTLTALTASTQVTDLTSFDQQLIPDTDSGIMQPSQPEEAPNISVEREDVLIEELAALDKTGRWGDDTAKEEPPVPPEVVVYDFPVTINKQVEFYLDLFQNRQRKYFQRWLARSTLYVPYIQEELTKAKLPTDLAYLAMIESGFNPSAYSKAHAAGLWQFIRGTGRNYGLRIDSWVDERREPVKATKAAIGYLSKLYAEFDDWYLAVAAYNAGEGKIGRAIKKYKTRDFWELASHRYLKLETKRYVPKLIAAIIISRDPEKYGFHEIQYMQPDQFDLITVPAGTDLAAVAVTANTSVKKLRKLNNELRKSRTPPNQKKYILRIPDGSYNMVAQNMKRLHPVITTAYKTHTVRSGDTLNRVCRKYNLNKLTLLKANSLRSGTLKKGQRLRIPYRTTKYVLLKDGETPQSRFAMAGKDGKLILHEIKKGETLSRISKKYNVPVDIIMQWNDISDVRRIRAGHHLALYMDTGSPVPPPISTPSVATVINSSKIPLLRDQKKFQVATLTLQKARTLYKVRNGDSLWTIAKKFRVSATDLRRWNNLENNMIHPGEKLVIRKG